MSSRALNYAFNESETNGSDRMLLVAMADAARDDGYLSGDEFGSMNQLTRKCGFGSKQTTIDARDRLERQGELLIRRPTDRGHGQYFEYVLVMSRDRAVLLATFGWKIANRSTGQTAAAAEAAQSSYADPGVTSPISPAIEQEEPHRGAQAAPPANQEQTNEPVENRALDPSNTRSNGQTAPPGLPDGPDPVRSRSDLQRHSPYSQEQPPLQLAHGPQRGRARDAVNDPVDIGLFAELRQALAPLAPDVLWDLRPQQLDQLAEHATRWPAGVSPVPDFVASTVENLRRYGPPHSARAWVSGWLDVDPPADVDGEPMCLEHQLDGYPAVPLRLCAPCRENARIDSAQ